MNWINSRIDILINIMIEIIIFIIIYSLDAINIDQKIIYGLVSIFFIFLWTTFSYVIGRYYLIRSKRKRFLYVYIIKTLVLTFSSLSLLNLIFDLTNFFSKEIFIISLLKSIFLILILGFLIFLVPKNKIKESWIFIGSKESFKYFKKISSKEDLLIIQKDQEDLLNIDINSFQNIIFNDIEELNLETTKKLLFFRLSEKKIFSLKTWCQEKLERIPNDLFDKYSLYNLDFNVGKKYIQQRFKRISDFLISLLILVFSFPILIILMILIKLEDGGPIFYSQFRCGKFGKPIKIYKLRSMKINAEENGAIWSKKNDPRITKIGNFLRKSRLDELPQLISVLKGEMSLIGPRPERPEFDEILIQKISNYNLRYLMKPGISGWAQVNFPYGASIEDSTMKLSFDLYYLINFSFWLDLLILLKTIKLVFNRQGAIESQNIPRI